MESQNRASLHSRIRSLVSASLVVALFLNAQAQNSAQPSKSVKVKRGQTLSLSLLTTLDSSRDKVGDEVRAKLDRPLVVDGGIIIPAGWAVRGTVTKVKRAGKKCHDGRIEWKIREISTPKGARVKVQQVRSYPSANQSGDPDWVSLDTPLDKIARVPEYIGLTTFVIALSPLLIPMGVAMRGSCDGEPGHDQVLPAGGTYLYAVSGKTCVASLP